MALVLASRSPRRRALMEKITPHFVVDEADVAEEGIAAAGPAPLALALACAKAQNVAARRKADVVIGCDTVVELEGATLGKPHTPAEAHAMLAALSGARHYVHTGVCMLSPGAAPCSFVETTAVDFAPIPPAAIKAYIQTEEPYDKAGGYGIQGWAGRYIPRIEGCYYNVMGLPLAALYSRLLAAGLLPG